MNNNKSIFNHLLQKISKEFPNLKWRKAKHITCGWDHDVIILDKKWVFRFPKTSHYKHFLENEIKLLSYLGKKISLKVPQYISLARDKSFAAYPVIPGKELKPWIYRKLPKAIKKHIARELGLFLTELHRTPLAIAKKYRGAAGDNERNFELVVKETQRYLYPRFLRAEKQKVEAYFMEFRQALKGIKKKVLTHNDLSWEHILIKENKTGLAGIIDFTDRIIDDPALDFALLERYSRYGPRFLKIVYKYYGLKKDQRLLYRAKLYLKKVYLWHMIDALKGNPHYDFQKEYQRFKKEF